MAEQEHKARYTIDGDHPTVLCGGDNGVPETVAALAA